MEKSKYVKRDNREPKCNQPDPDDSWESNYNAYLKGNN